MGMIIAPARFGGFDPASTALFARMTTQPDATRKGLIDTLIKALKAGGVWAKLELLYLLAAHEAPSARLNWIAAANNLTAVSSPTFTTDRGYAGDGATSYLDTGWLPSASTLFLLNSASMGCWLNAGTDTAANVTAMGCRDASARATLIPRGSAGFMRGGLNVGTNVNGPGTMTTRLGFTAFSRTGSSNDTAYRNNAAAETMAANASVARSIESLFLCGGNGIGVLEGASNNRVAMAFAGAGLSDPEVAGLYTAVSTFLTAIGAN